MYINVTEERHFKAFLDDNTELRSAIGKLLGEGRYKALDDNDRAILYTIGLKGVFSELSNPHPEIAHKTIQFISYIYELNEEEYLKMVRLNKAFTAIETYIHQTYLKGDELDKSKFHCAYNPNNSRLPLTAKDNTITVDDSLITELEYIRRFAYNSSEAEREAGVLTTYTNRVSHLTDFTENMVVFHVDGCPFFIILD